MTDGDEKDRVEGNSEAESGAIPSSEKELSAEEKEKRERAREEFNMHEADYRRNPHG